MAGARFSFTAEVWEWEGKAAWHFVSLPEEIADEIEDRYGGSAGGFGSVRVEVVIGRSRWKTSLFPDSKRATYVLPVKKPVRTAEKLDAGTSASVEITVLQGEP